MAQTGNRAVEIKNAEIKNIVFVIGEREYFTKESLQSFSDEHLGKRYKTVFILADPDHPNEFPGIDQLQNADLLVLSVRRRTLKTEAFAFIKDYFDAGKPLVAVRTSSHSFHMRKESPPPGHAEWRTFDVDILGHTYEGHFGNDLHPTISIAPGAEKHILLDDTGELSYVSGGSLYKSRALLPSTEVLLEGTINSGEAKEKEPVAWTNIRETSHGTQRIFYTSLGHTSDFKQAGFQRLLLNAINWSLE